MAFKFTDAARYPYQQGGFFLGLDDQNREVGINTERHLITVAGAGSGKGATLIVPNLRRWRGSAVVVDPKGENATLTAGDRADMGQLVGVVDPYQIVKGDAAALRCSINPLAVMKPESLTIRADLEALGDGLIRRHDPRHAQWDDTAAAITAGLADFVISTEPPEAQNLLNVRALLLLPEDTLKAVAAAMIETVTPAGLARQAGAMIQNKFSNVDGVPAQAFARAVQETGWIDDPAFASVLGGDKLPAFDLSTLKAGTGSLYLCIPPSYLDTRGGFLRLFVRMGLMTMMSDLAAHGGGGRCLFLLDEFHSLGKVDLVAKAAGLMRGYGVQLWPFLQDMGQLEALYGPNEMMTFFENADAHIFFGNSGKATLEHISERIGPITADEIGQAFVTPSSRHLDSLAAAANRQHSPIPIDPKQPYGFAAFANDMAVAGQNSSRAKYDRKTRQHQEAVADARAQYEHKMRAVGSPRIEPSAVAELIGKKDGDEVAPSAIVFAKGGEVFKVRLRPYWKERAAKKHRAAKAAAVPTGASFIARERASFRGIHPVFAYGGILALGLLFYQYNTGRFSFALGLALILYGGLGFAVTLFEMAKPFIPRPSLKQKLAYSTLTILGLLLIAATGERDGMGGYAAFTLMIMGLAALAWLAISGIGDIFRWIRRL